MEVKALISRQLEFGRRFLVLCVYAFDVVLSIVGTVVGSYTEALNDGLQQPHFQPS